MCVLHVLREHWSSTKDGAEHPGSAGRHKLHRTTTLRPQQPEREAACVAAQAVGAMLLSSLQAQPPPLQQAPELHFIPHPPCYKRSHSAIAPHQSPTHFGPHKLTPTLAILRTWRPWTATTS